jgi:hypothetical protein
MTNGTSSRSAGGTTSTPGPGPAGPPGTGSWSVRILGSGMVQNDHGGPEVMAQTPGGWSGLLNRVRHLLLGCDMVPHFIITDWRLVRVGEACLVCGEERR